MTSRTPAPLPGDVQLRDTTEADLPILFEHQLDPDATRMAAFPSRERDAFMAHWTKILADDSGTRQTILYDGQVAGNIVSWTQDGERDVGYWLGKQFWGKGIATRALSAFLRHVTERPLYAHVTRHNIGSRRVLEKCGFVIVDEPTLPSNTNGDELYEFRLVLRGHDPAPLDGNVE